MGNIGLPENIRPKLVMALSTKGGKKEGGYFVTCGGNASRGRASAGGVVASWRGSRASKERSASRAPRPGASRCLGLLAASFDGERRRAQPRPDRTDVLLVSRCLCSRCLCLRRRPGRPSFVFRGRGIPWAPGAKGSRLAGDVGTGRGRAVVDIFNAVAGPSYDSFFFVGESDLLHLKP